MVRGRVASARRVFRSRRILLLGVTVVTVVAVALVAYALYLRQVASNVTRADLLPSAPKVSEATAAPAKPSDTPTSSPAVKLPNTGMNFLIIGSDTGAVGGGRSDVIVLAHVSEARDRVSLISFPRDLSVSVPGQGMTAINAVYASGGSQLLVTTVQDLLGVVVDHVAVTSLEGFARMTDALGGVDVSVSEPRTSNGYSFKPGTTHMNGPMALAFVGVRPQSSGGDASQGQRQQAFVKAFMRKALSPGSLSNPLQLARFMDAASSSFTVDNALGPDQMSSLAVGLLSVRADDISFLTAPSAGSATLPTGGAVKLQDVPKIRALGEAVRTDRMQDYAS